MNYINLTKGANESSLAVVKNDGTLMHIFTEERYSRIKYDNRFPFNSIKNMSIYNSKDLLLDYYSYDSDLINLFKLFFPNIMVKKVIKPNHHLLHCYESFYTSGFNRAAVLVVDGHGTNYDGDYESISLYHKIGFKNKILKKYYLKESLGGGTMLLFQLLILRLMKKVTLWVYLLMEYLLKKDMLHLIMGK